MFMKSVIAAAVIAASVTVASAADISGAGATFPFPIYAKWADAYKKDTGNGLNYQSIGSGAGIKQIKAKTVTFGATDAPLKPEELDKAGLAQWPMVMGGIVAVVNLDGVKPGDIVIDGPTLAQIYLGKITKWNDPALKKLNPKLNLPDLPICRIHRADGSGTTFNFTYYLGEVSPDWKVKVGVATTVDWPGGIGAKGNDGVANNVATTKGAIGYVEYAYAKQNKLTYANMINKAGKDGRPDHGSRSRPRPPTPIGTHAPGFYLILANQPGDKSWPMTAATFILHAQGPGRIRPPRRTRSTSSSGPMRRATRWPQDLDYIPMPDNVVKLVEAMWAKDIKQK